jgi:hypothetical protein
MRGLDGNRFNLALLLLLIISVIFTSKAVVSTLFEEVGKPLALGFGEDGRFVLYSDGEVHKLLGQNQTVKLSKIQLTSEIVKAAIVDFEVYGQNLYLYLYMSLNATSGKTMITVYNLTSGVKTFTRMYEFTITQENQLRKVKGDMVLAASACHHALAVITANTTHTLIEVFKEKRGGFEKAAVYSGRMAMSIYKYGETLIAATFRVEVKNNTSWIMPQITDIVENKTLFRLPALIPVAALAYPFIQPFNRNNAWECHATVYNPTMNRIEYYIVYPEKQGLGDSNATTVSPYMDYLIIDQQKGSKIVFRNGESIATNQKLSIIPQGAFMPLNPQNGVLDVDPRRKALLAKIVEEGKAKILYITEKSVKEIYILNASLASKTEGFYAALAEDTVYIINPKSHDLVVLLLGNVEKQEDYWGLVVVLAGTIVLIVALTLLIIHRKNWIKRRRYQSKSLPSSNKLIILNINNLTNMLGTM